MLINIPDWCIIGKKMAFRMNDTNHNGKPIWCADKIVSYTTDGFYHAASNCPTYHSLFTDYGTTVKELSEVELD